MAGYLKAILLISFFLPGSWFSTAFSQPSPAMEPLRLRVVFPTDGDTLNFASVRFAGSTLTGAQVRVQGKPTNVFSSGAFVGMVALEPGWNTLRFSGNDRYGRIEKKIRIYRQPESLPLPVSPTRLDSLSLQPGGDVFVRSGETLVVTFRGSPAGRASCTLGNLLRNVGVREIPPERNDDQRGFYRGELRIPAVDSVTTAHLSVTLRGRDGATVRATMPNPVTILPEGSFLTAVTIDSLTNIYRKPDGDFWLALPQGVILKTVSRQHGFTKIVFADGVTGYASTHKLRFAKSKTGSVAAEVADPVIWQDKNWIFFNVAVSARVPFHVEASPQNPYLELQLFYTRDSAKWLLRPPEQSAVTRVYRFQEGRTCILRFELNHQHSWGYRAWYADGRLYLNIRKAPLFSGGEHLPLHGLAIALDAGHGGESDGAISATGLLEKNLNLFLTQEVGKRLRQLGATVIATRQRDDSISLAQRVRLARDHQVHMFVSIHQNSINPNTDPWRPRGTSTYYSYAQSQTLAHAIYSQMVRTGLKPFGSKPAAFFVTRQSDFLSCLVEGAFLTHPLDEIFLLRQDALERMAGAIVRGITNFVEKQRSLVAIETLPGQSSETPTLTE